MQKGFKDLFREGKMSKYKSIAAGFESATGLKLGNKFSYSLLFNLEKYPRRVVKISPCYNFAKVARVVRLFKKSNNPAVVKIYKFGTFEVNQTKYYYYIMEKLNKLPRSCDEEFINLFVATYKRKNGNVPEFVSNKFKLFIKRANAIKLKYKDVHPGNIMIDNGGNYKFIDLESFTY